MNPLALEACKNYLATRTPDSHKGNFGHVLVVGGDYGFGGACRLASEAALRAGAGLVSVATRSENAFAITSGCPELMCFGVAEPKNLDLLLDRATVVVVGPGLGQSAWGQALFKRVLQSHLPLIVDGDALNLLGQAPESREHWILTPHPGEAARLLQQSTASIQENRAASIKLLHDKYQGVMILKGKNTLVFDASDIPSVCPYGNPGMATAGMGDVLTGIIAALVAQKLTLLEAAKLGVVAHAVAGDLAAQDGARGILARDVIQHLRVVLN